MTRRRFPLWTALGVVLVVALVFGSGVLSSSPPTPAQRAAAIESSVRCPTCEDLSVAQSTAPTAVAVRGAITQLIAEGRTDQQIQSYLAARYGSSIELDPPGSGWSLLVWLLPLLAGVVAVTALVAVLVRRRRLSDGPPQGGVRTDDPAMSPEAAEERRQFLTRSLADADAEYLAGDLSDQDYLELRQRDMRRLAALPAATADRAAPGGVPTVVSLAAGEQSAGSVSVLDPSTEPSPAPGEPPNARLAPPRRSRRSWWFLAGAVVAFAGALILAVSLFATNRQPGQSITGSFAETQQQQIEETLAQAATDENQGDAGQAAQLYQSVLDKHPDNEVALAQLGWLEYQTGVHGKSAQLVADARTKLQRALRLDPGDYAARLYFGTLILQRDDNPAGAVAQYRLFLADKPPAALVTQASAEIRSAFQAAGLPVPAGLPAG